VKSNSNNEVVIKKNWLSVGNSNYIHTDPYLSGGRTRLSHGWRYRENIN
jgi:hypothetical protein